MHILIAFLGSLVTVFYLLDRLGIDIGGFNPFHWRRKRAWSRQYHSDPVYSVADPLHIVTLERFKAVFSLQPKEASELVGSAIHLLGAPQIIDAQLQGLADKNKTCFTQEQADSMLQLMVEVVSADGEVTAAQSAFIETMRTHFVPPQPNQGTWS